MSDLAQVLLAALGVAISPVPVVAVLIILLTKRARLGSLVFAVAWVAGNVTAIIIAVTFADSLGAPRRGVDYPAEGGVALLLGIGLVVIAWLARRGRRQSQAPADPPRWVEAVDNLSPSGGAFVAFTNATTSPKNLALAISAGVTIANSGVAADETLAALVYVIVASLTVVIPVAVYFVAGERATPVITRWKRNITARAAIIMEVVLLVLGIALSVRGLSNLLG